MKTFPTAALTWMFTRLPSPLVALAAAALAVFFVSDVAIPDFLPFLDEAVLALLFTGAMTELIQRRKARGSAIDASSRPADDLSGVRGRGSKEETTEAHFSASQGATTPLTKRSGVTQVFRGRDQRC